MSLHPELSTARPELRRVRAILDDRAAGVLLVGGPGSGKTTLLETAFEGRDDGTTVLRCDDVDRVDPKAARELARRRRDGASVALTTRGPGLLPVPIAELVDEGLVEIVRLEPLPLDLLEQHLGGLLGGRVEHETVRDLRRLTGGDLRLLHALVADGRHSGRLTERNGVWIWHDGVEAGPDTSALVTAGLRRLHPEELMVLELVALARPVDSPSVLAVLDALDFDAAGLDRLILTGELVEDAPGGELRLTRPIIASVLRRHVTPARRRHLLRTLLEHEPEVNRPHVRIGRVRWMLDCGRRPEPAECLDAARTAAEIGENRTVIELTGHLLNGGADPTTPRVEVRILRADAARILGHHDVARRDLTAAAEHLDRTDDHGLRLAIARRRADLAQYVDDDPDLALDLVAAEMPGDDGSGDLAVRAELALREGWAGRFETAIPAAREVLAEPGLDPHQRLRLVTPTVLGLTAQGRFHEALDLLDDNRPEVQHLRIDARSPDVEFRSARFHLLLSSGRLDDAARLLASAERTEDWEFPPLRHIGRGQLAACRGRRQEAVEHLRIAVEALRGDDPIGFLPLAVAESAFAEAMAGHGERARRLHDELPEIPLGTCRALEAPISLARARTAVVLDLSDADELVAAVVEDCRRRGRHLVELAARHLQAWRWHRTATSAAPDHLVTEVRECVAAVEGPVGPALGQHAESLLRDPRRTRPNVTAVTAVGVPLPTPARTTRLTSRQEQVARLAAGGMASRDIAGELFISVRTVDAHLRQVFLLLGVNRRGDLAAALATLDPS